MSSERKQILDMLAEGKINTDDAERLLDAINQNTQASASTGTQPNRKKPTYLHVKVDSEGGSKRDNVDIKIPIMLLKAGMKFSSMLPDSAKIKFATHLENKGIDIDLNKLDAEKIDILIQALSENSIDIDSDREKVKIYCA